MRKYSKLLICVLALTLVVAFMPTMAFAAGTAKDKVKVSLTAGAPDKYIAVDQAVEATGNLAETYFPDVAELEPAGVSFLDVLVAAHINKYGKNKVKDTLNVMVVPASDTNPTPYIWLTKVFDRTDYGMFWLDYSLGKEANPAMKNGNSLFLEFMVDTKTWSDVYANFEFNAGAKEIKAEAGQKVTLEAWGLGNGNPTKLAVKTVDKKTLALKTLKATVKGKKATVTFDKTGTYYVVPSGKWVSSMTSTEASICGDIFKVTVTKPSTGKVTKLKATVAKGKKINASWKKVSGAAGYQVSYKVKGAKKFTTKNVTKNKVTLTKLKVGKQYIVKVKAYKKAGSKKYYGKEAKVTSKKVVA